MTGLDTNVLLRYLLQDDPVQFAAAERMLEHRVTAQSPGFVSLITTIEIAWVLENVYRCSSQETAETIERILQIDSLLIQNRAEVTMAMLTIKSGQGSFSDALIGALGLWAGCTATLTFDRKASRLPGFELIL